MKILYSNILPMGLEDGQMSVADCFREQSERASSNRKLQWAMSRKHHL